MELFVWFLFVVCFLFAVRIFVVVLGRDALMARPLRGTPVWRVVAIGCNVRRDIALDWTSVTDFSPSKLANTPWPPIGRGSFVRGAWRLKNRTKAKKS
jgi:hypothetical protein